MIDWNGLVLGPVMGIFGQGVSYTTVAGQTVSLIDGVFDQGTVVVDVPGQPGILSSMPLLGARMSQMPIGWDPEKAQGDMFTLANGASYEVKAAKADSHGFVRIEANQII